MLDLFLIKEGLSNGNDFQNIFFYFINQVMHVKKLLDYEFNFVSMPYF